MSDRFFVDTTILMYAHDAAAGTKHEMARALFEQLWQRRSGVVSTPILQGLCVNLRRKAKRPVDTRTSREILAFSPHPSYFRFCSGPSSGDRKTNRAAAPVTGSTRIVLSFTG